MLDPEILASTSASGELQHAPTSSTLSNPMGLWLGFAGRCSEFGIVGLGPELKADSPRKRNSQSPSWREQSRSRSRSRSRGRSRSRSRSWSRARHRSRSRSRGRSRSRSRGRAESGNPGNTLYVTGLSQRVTERDLEEHFSKEGKVASCFLVVEPRTRISRGFAFVNMDSVEDANRCIKYLNQSVLEGRYITVERNSIVSAMLAAIKDDEIIHLNLSQTSMINGQLKQLEITCDQLD
ncbi:hypothetical protein V6N13_111673 [Hibiscus sabdariffa]